MLTLSEVLSFLCGKVGMKTTMLGTGNALVTECYNTCFIIEHEWSYAD